MKKNSRMMTASEIRRRITLVISTGQPSLYALQRLTGIDDQDLKRYRARFIPSYERRMVLSDLFRKIDLGIYELYQRPGRGARGRALIWDLRIATDPRPPVSACVTFTAAGPKLRFKTTAEIMGYETWQPPESVDLLSSKLNVSSKNIVV